MRLTEGVRVLVLVLGVKNIDWVAHFKKPLVLGASDMLEKLTAVVKEVVAW